MPTTFSTAKVALDEIAANIQNARKSLQNAKAAITQAKALLDAMPTTYATIVSDINSAAAAGPSNVALTTMKAEKDALVSEFTALSTTAGQMQTAVANITV
jgi:F0F1-type ATP synthase membrane subunit b/b'